MQEAASILIECLIHTGDFSKAELYAQLTFDSLKDPANKVNQQSEAMVKGYHNLGEAISSNEDGDLVKAEKLAREAVSIRTRLYVNDHAYVGESTLLLANILFRTGNLGDEVKKLYERSLAIHVLHAGLDGFNTSNTNFVLGEFHHQIARTHPTGDKRKEHFRLSKSYYEEALRVYRKIIGPTHRNTMIAESKLTMVSFELSKI